MPETIFSKIIAKEIPAKIAYEDDDYLVIHDIQPAAPVHLLVIPKKKAIRTLNDLSDADAPLVGGMFLVARLILCHGPPGGTGPGPFPMDQSHVPCRVDAAGSAAPGVRSQV